MRVTVNGVATEYGEKATFEEVAEKHKSEAKRS